MAIAAAQAAGLHYKIMGLPDNYWTIIGNTSDSARALAQHAEHACDSESCSGHDEQAPHVHVPSAEESELLAMARKYCLALQTVHRTQRLQPQWRRKHAALPLGEVPDFQAAHQALARRCVRARQRAVAAGLTVPREFDFETGRSSARASHRVCADTRRDGCFQVHEVCITSEFSPHPRLRFANRV